jgi:rhamnosyltransferase
MIKVGAIVVTYNFNNDLLLNNLESYYNQFNEILIVDNSILSDFTLVNKTFSRVKIIELNENKGIAFAQNIGYRYFQSKKYDFVIELDQDTSLKENYVKLIIDEFKFLCSKGIKLVSLTGVPNFLHLNEKKSFVPNILETYSSGSLFLLSYIEEIGYKNEYMFIDLVDWEWFWRAQHLGYHIYSYPQATFIHKQGDELFEFFGLKIKYSSYIRNYYSFRNSIFLLKFSHIPFNIKLILNLKIVIKLLTYPLLLKNKKKRFLYMVKGIFDGIKSIV